MRLQLRLAVGGRDLLPLRFVRPKAPPLDPRPPALSMCPGRCRPAAISRSPAFRDAGPSRSGYGAHLSRLHAAPAEEAHLLKWAVDRHVSNICTRLCRRRLQPPPTPYEHGFSDLAG